MEALLFQEETVQKRRWVRSGKYVASALVGALTLYVVLFALGQAPGLSHSASPLLQRTSIPLGAYVEMTAEQRDANNSAPAATWPLCNMRGVWTQDSNRCECYECVTGTNCTTLTPEASCRITATSGQPYMMQEFWNDYVRGEAPTNYAGTPINWRGPYQNSARYTSASPTDPSLDNQLNQAIRNLHTKYDNIVLGTNDNIIITTGATQFWSAAMWALAKRAADTSSAPLPLYVFERTPYYFGHPNMVNGGTLGEMLNPNLCVWDASTNLSANRVVEVLTQPSNPIGDFYDPIYPTGNKRIYDLVYYWPHLAPITKRFNETIMFFSLTKLSGHAATRFGWAVVKDTTLATTISSFISANTMGPSVDIKWRALNVIKDVTNSNYVDFVTQTMKDRWVRIMEWFNSGQTRFQLLSVPGTAYIYTLCLQDTNCGAVFTGAGIDGFTGARFGDSRNVYRINLTLHSYAFDLLMQKLWKLTTYPNEEIVQQWLSNLPPAPNYEHIKIATEDMGSQY